MESLITAAARALAAHEELARSLSARGVAHYPRRVESEKQSTQYGRLLST
jgi:hypothetical protein